MNPDFHKLSTDFEDRNELCFWPEVSGESWRDVHLSHRARVILGLQYARGNPEIDFLRFLFEQEILRASHDPFQGLSEELEVVAWLLSEFGRPADVHLFLRAKFANFDCHCGFDPTYVVSSGLETLMLYLEESEIDPKIRTDLQAFLAERDFTDELIEEWRSRTKARFDVPWEEETLSYRYRRLLRAGLIEEADELLGLWESQVTEAKRPLAELRYAHTERNHHDKSAALSRRILKCDLSISEQVAEWGHLTESLTLAGRYDEALRAAKTYSEALGRLKNWWKLGYGRDAARRAYLLACQDFPHSDQALALADKLEAKLTLKPPVVVELMVTAHQLRRL